MKIQIITEREIKDEDYWDWANSIIQGTKRADPKSEFDHNFFAILKEHKEASVTTDLNYTKAKTTYKIL